MQPFCNRLMQLLIVLACLLLFSGCAAPKPKSYSSLSGQEPLFAKMERKNGTYRFTSITNRQGANLVTLNNTSPTYDTSQYDCSNFFLEKKRCEKGEFRSTTWPNPAFGLIVSIGTAGVFFLSG